MPGAANIVDIARRAGVGKSTAARALCGRGSVSDQTRRKVLQAAAALKYRANVAARTLRRGENRVLGVVVPDRLSRGVLSRAISSQKIEGLARGAKRRGYDLQIFIEDLTDGDALSRLATERFVRGLFFLGPVAAGVLDHLDSYNIPWVGLNWRHKDRTGESYCWTDFIHAGCLLAGHMLDIGCRKILAFDWLSPDYGPFDDGLTRAARDRGLGEDVLTVLKGRQYAGGRAVEAALVDAFAGDAPPDGLLLGHQDGALAAYRYLRSKHPTLELGRDLALVAFDDLDVPRHMDPALTAYAQDTYGMGESAVDELDRMLAAGKRLAVSRALPGSLLVRASSERFRPGG